LVSADESEIQKVLGPQKGKQLANYIASYKL
jgi:hypothetical protein